MTNSLATWCTSIIVCLCISVSEQQRLAPIYWNRTGNTFSMGAQFVMKAPLSSWVDIVCPFYSSSQVAWSSIEYYLIYRVSQAAYNSCNLYTSNGTTPQLLVNCSAPFSPRSATINFLRYSSVVGEVDFQVGLTYYYISTSSGTQSGMFQTSGGVCSSANMRIAFDITESTSSSTSTTLSKSTTSGPLIQPLISSSTSCGHSASMRKLRLLAHCMLVAFMLRLITAI